MSIPNDNMSNDELRLHMGELTAEECNVARAAIGWSNRSIMSKILEIESKYNICGETVAIIKDNIKNNDIR